MLTHPSGLFRDISKFPSLEWCRPLNILRANIKNLLKIQHVRAYNFGNSGSNITKFARGRCHNMGTTVGMGAPTKFGVQKTSKIRRDF